MIAWTFGQIEQEPGHLHPRRDTNTIPPIQPGLTRDAKDVGDFLRPRKVTVKHFNESIFESFFLSGFARRSRARLQRCLRIYNRARTAHGLTAHAALRSCSSQASATGGGLSAMYLRIFAMRLVVMSCPHRSLSGTRLSFTAREVTVDGASLFPVVRHSRQ